ncbi:MAG: hypothetical protein J6Y82_01720 [Bacteroidales bacterium]|nr:hypothetical protein [Bacteroidales bacterium]
MATMTINYDARNKAVRSIVRMIEESGLFDIMKALPKKSPYSKAFVDKIKKAEAELDNGLGIEVTDINAL